MQLTEWTKGVRAAAVKNTVYLLIRPDTVGGGEDVAAAHQRTAALGAHAIAGPATGLNGQCRKTF
jgi:hypothetical protein